MKAGLTTVMTVTLALVMPSPSQAYRLSGQKWPRAETTFYYDIVDTEGNDRSPSGTSWNAAFREAMDRWTTRTGFVFDGIEGIRPDPCKDDNRNTVAFRRDDCGFEFGSATLAITYSVFSRGLLKETDILFNDNERWDVYDGPVRSYNDFTRVAVHELGHALGLDHEDSVPSIMSTLVGDLTLPQLDDVQGILALYEGEIDPPQPCKHSPLPLNTRIEDQLESSDCRRADIASTANGSDDSLVDLYRLEMPTTGLVVIRMRSDTVDAYVEIRDDTGNTIIASDDDSGIGVNAFLAVRLEKGRYQVVANTAFSWAQEGKYTLQALFQYEGEAPSRVNEDKSITLDAVEYAGLYYQATLVPFTPDSGPDGRYWRLVTASLLSPQPQSPLPGAVVSPDSLDLIFNPIPALERLYDAILERYYDPELPEAKIWRLKSAVPRP